MQESRRGLLWEVALHESAGPMKSTNPLSRLFGPNPFSMLKSHMRVVISCAEKLPGLFEAVIAGNQQEVERLQQEVFAIEAEADIIKREVRQHLPRTILLPVNRGDLIDLLILQDKIANTTQDIAGLVVERKMDVPPGIRDHLMPFVTTCLEVCHHSATIIEELDELLETGFSGPEAYTVSEMIDRLNKLEDASDQKGMDISRALFAHEDSLSPVSVIFWYRLIEWIGDTADHAEAVGERLQLMIDLR